MSATLKTVEEVEVCEVAETVEEVELCEVATVSLPWGVEAVVLVVLVGVAGRCVDATRAMTDTTRTIVTRSVRVLRGGPPLFIGAAEHVVTIEDDGT